MATKGSVHPHLSRVPKFLVKKRYVAVTRGFLEEVSPECRG